MNTPNILVLTALATLSSAPFSSAANYLSPDSAQMVPAANYGNGINVVNGAGLPGNGVADLNDANILSTSHTVGFNRSTQFVRDGGTTSATFTFTFNTPTDIGSLYLWNYTQAGCCPGRGLGNFEVFLDTGTGFASVGTGSLVEASEIAGNHFAQEVNLGAVYSGVVGIQIVASNNGGNAIGLDEIVVADDFNATNTPPSEIVLTSNQIFDFEARVGAPAGMLSNNDRDFGDSHTYALVPGSGDDDNGRFEIIDDRLIFRLDTTAGDYSLRLKVTDSLAASHQEILTVRVLENSPPEVVGFSGGVILEMLEAPQPAGRVLSDDPDFALANPDEHEFSLVSGEGDDDNASFEVDPQSGSLTFNGTAPAGRLFSIRVRVTDRGGLTGEMTLTVTTRSSFGRSLTSRAFATDNATTVLHPNNVAIPIATTASGVDFYLQNTSLQNGRTFRIFLLRPTGSPDQFDVIYDSGEITVEGTSDGEVVYAPFPNGPVEVEAGDHFAHYGSGIPYSQGTPTSTPIYFSVISPPIAGTQIQLGFANEPAYPFRGDLSRDYAWAISHDPGIEPLGDLAISYLSDSDRLSLSWTAEEGHRYRIEGSSDLTTWPDLIESSFAPTTTDAVFQFPMPPNASAYFRVIDLGINR